MEDPGIASLQEPSYDNEGSISANGNTEPRQSSSMNQPSLQKPSINIESSLRQSTRQDLPQVPSSDNQDDPKLSSSDLPLPGHIKKRPSLISAATSLQTQTEPMSSFRKRTTSIDQNSGPVAPL